MLQFEKFDKETVAKQLSTCFRTLSAQAKYCNNPAQALLLTWELVELQVFLWSDPKDNAIVVEIQHLQGNRTIFDRYAGFILDAAAGKFDAEKYQQTPSGDLNLESLQSAEEIFQSVMPKTREESLKSFAGALLSTFMSLKSDRMNIRIEGMEQLCFLSDPRQTRLAVSVLASRALLLGADSITITNESLSKNIRKVREIVVATIQQEGSEEGSHESLVIMDAKGVFLNRALTVLKQSLEVLVFLHDMYFLDSENKQEPVAAVAHNFLRYAQDIPGNDLLSTLVQMLGRAKQEPHNACLSVTCLRLFCTASEAALQGIAKSKVIEAARNAHEYGVSSHAKIETETERFLKAVINEDSKMV